MLHCVPHWRAPHLFGRSHPMKHAPHLREVFLSELFKDWMIISRLSRPANVFTTPPLTHSCALRGSSSCADFKSPMNHPNLRPLLSSHNVCLSTHAWFHVYSLKKSNCSGMYLYLTSYCFSDIIVGIITAVGKDEMNWWW